MRYALFVATFALLIVASCAEPAAYHYKASGTILDESGAPVQGVQVILRGYDLERARQVTGLTGMDGTFVIKFDIDPFEWRQEAHWVFDLMKEGYTTRSVAYPQFSFDDRFRQQGYWYEVFFRGPVTIKKAKPVEQPPVKGEEQPTPTAMPMPTIMPSAR